MIHICGSIAIGAARDLCGLLTQSAALNMPPARVRDLTLFKGLKATAARSRVCLPITAVLACTEPTFAVRIAPSRAIETNARETSGFVTEQMNETDINFPNSSWPAVSLAGLLSPSCREVTTMPVFPRSNILARCIWPMASQSEMYGRSHQCLFRLEEHPPPSQLFARKVSIVLKCRRTRGALVRGSPVKAANDG